MSSAQRIFMYLPRASDMALLKFADCPRFLSFWKTRIRGSLKPRATASVSSVEQLSQTMISKS